MCLTLWPAESISGIHLQRFERMRLMKKKTSRIILGSILAAAAAGSFGMIKLFKDVIVRKEEEKEPLAASNSQEEQSRIALWRQCNAWLNEQPCEKVSIESFDGLTLKGEFFKGEGEPKSTVLLVHGYRCDRRREYAPIASFLIQSGYNVLMVDDRAHGESEGRYIGFGCLDREDCYRWVRYLNQRFDGKQNLFLHGISMGAATVLMTSGLNLPGSVKGIVADCGFTTPSDQFVHILKKNGLGCFRKGVLAVTGWICKKTAGYGFDDCSAVESVSRSKVPIFIIHGTSDDFVPTRMAKEIYQACPGKKELWLVEGAAHARNYYHSTEEYQQRMLAFFNECLKGDAHEN